MKPLALVTGAGGGVGQAAVAAFLEAGWRVIGVDRRPLAEAPGPDATLHLLDVADPEAVGRFFAGVAAREAGLHALVNNAAVQVCRPLLETSLEEWDAVMAANLRAAFVVTRAAHPLLKAVAGAIVNVSSIHAVATSAGLGAYATSKGGLVALTRSMAIEFGADGVRANCVLPGATDTPMLREGLQRGHVAGAPVEDRLAGLGRRHALGRVAAPAEIAQAIVFLADSGRSSFVTGQTLAVDGGALIRLGTE